MLTSIESLSLNQVTVQSLPSVPCFLHAGVRVDMLRLDQLHPQVSGNKWFKLKGYLERAMSEGCSTIMSFGGAWSNHIHALAAAGKQLGIKTVGIIRGEGINPSPTLRDAAAWGMQLHYVSRKDYRLRHTNDYPTALIKQLHLHPDGVLVVPEGGSGPLGVLGCETILSAGQVAPNEYDEIWLASGTGATLAGIVRSAGGNTRVKGIAVLKGADFLWNDVAQLSGIAPDNWVIDTQHHCGGYAKTSVELLTFIQEFESDTGIALDQVYTGKAMLALKKTIEKGGIKPGSRLLMIHTGGLQGKRGLSFA